MLIIIQLIILSILNKIQLMFKDLTIILSNFNISPLLKVIRQSMYNNTIKIFGTIYNLKKLNFLRLSKTE